MTQKKKNNSFNFHFFCILKPKKLVEKFQKNYLQFFTVFLHSFLPIFFFLPSDQQRRNRKGKVFCNSNSDKQNIDFAVSGYYMLKFLHNYFTGLKIFSIKPKKKLIKRFVNNHFYCCVLQLLVFHTFYICRLNH